MADITAEAFVRLVAGKTGHFRLESGLHSRLWLDLDALFANPAGVAPFIDVLAAQLRPFAVDVLCGPLLGGAFLAQRMATAMGLEFWYTQRLADREGEALFGARYGLPNALETRASGRRVALVDDVMSAGSSLRGSHAALTSAGAHVIVVGSLLQLGEVGAGYFGALDLPVTAAVREAFELYAPEHCPLCSAGAPILDLARPGV